MKNITYRKLNLDDCDRIQEIDPSQFIGKAWREKDGKRQLIQINYHDQDWPNGYEAHLSNLKSTIRNVGVAFGAFNEMGKLVGFSALNRDLFGKKYKYVLLDQIFISLNYRNKGIGKKLFMLCVDEAKRWHADKIYICAGSAEETIAFYLAMGCIEAMEINKELYDNDPRDYQLEYNI